MSCIRTKTTTNQPTNQPTKPPPPPPAGQLHDELRADIIANMYTEYVRTGYIWEQYDVAVGKEGVLYCVCVRAWVRACV